MSKKTRIPDVLTHVDENILKTIYRYYYMTVAQVVKSLGYRMNSLPTVRTRLAHITYHTSRRLNNGQKDRSESNTKLCQKHSESECKEVLVKLNKRLEEA